jgi:hypothetical protein
MATAVGDSSFRSELGVTRRVDDMDLVRRGEGEMVVVEGPIERDTIAGDGRDAAGFRILRTRTAAGDDDGVSYLQP